MAMVDIPSTYGALLLGGLIAAGYVPFVQFGQYALCDGRSKMKIIGRGHCTSLYIYQTLPVG
jgi:hypothetical protein